jgi:hypothetical protein
VPDLYILIPALLVWRHNNINSIKYEWVIGGINISLISRCEDEKIYKKPVFNSASHPSITEALL